VVTRAGTQPYIVASSTLLGKPASACFISYVLQISPPKLYSSLPFSPSLFSPRHSPRSTIMENPKDDLESLNTETMPVPQIQVMSPPTSPSKGRHEDRDTGFPEPFDGHRNTTRHHPDADTSPNACISADDLSLGHALKRRRTSFLHKHRRTVSHGYISPQTEAIHSILSLSMVDTNREDSKIHSPAMSSPRLSKDGTDSMGWRRRDEETPPSSPEPGEDEQSPKKGLFRRWRRGSKV
jgi:hypothetical protein